MLRAFASLQSEGLAGQARQLELSLAKPVDCVSSPEQLPEPARSTLLAALRANPPRGKLCHDNAWRVCAFEGAPFRMVSGYACAMIPMEHSWLRIDTPQGPIDFDPTDWTVFGGGKFTHHLEIVCIDSHEARNRASQTRHSGPWRQEILLEMMGIEPRSRPSAPAKKKSKPERARTVLSVESTHVLPSTLEDLPASEPRARAKRRIP
jgi:hypothetical protein